MPGQRHFRFLAIAALAVLAVTLAAALPSVSADGGGDKNKDMDMGKDQAPPIPEKRELKYPNLGSHLDQLVAQVEEGEASSQDAAGEAPMHRGESVAVTIYLSGSADDVVKFLEGNGGDPRNVGEDYIEAYVPVSLLGAVSERPGVVRVREIIPPQPAQLTQQVIGNGPAVHGSPAWNQAGYSGQGIKVGIIDDFRGFSALRGIEVPTTAVARCYTDIGEFSSNLADCEAVGNVSDYWPDWPECLDSAQRRANVSAEHGTWVAEALLDIAPGVELYIANPGSKADLRATVDWMASQGVTVINYSVGWTFDGPGDGTSPLSASPLNTVDRAVVNNILWVNAAGNNAQETWFGGYSDPDGDGYINFSSGDDEVIDMRFRACRRNTIQLRWDDNWDGASTDLDLHLYNKRTGEFVFSSDDVQSGRRGDVPFEWFWYLSRYDRDDLGIVVEHYGGDAPDWVQVVVWSIDPLEHHTLSGSITNPAESTNSGMLAVGASPWYDVETIESYSSRGPTPAGREKPDIVGADCGATALRPLNSRNRGFCGTSQAAPHVAGLAALVRQRFPDYTPAEVAGYLKFHAQQRETPDPNNTWGYGFAQLPSPDREALVALYNATGGANWTNKTNWMTNAPIGQWHGVTTDASVRVTELRLTRNQLKGDIPPELANLTNLKVLALGGNELTGTIPTWLGSLANLEELYLWENELTGTIPAQLGSLAKLGQLQLAENQLTGSIPTHLGSLSNLQELDFADNQLTGEIPAEMGSLSNLQELWLSENQLTGEIPAELRSLSNLVKLVLWGNELTGEIPGELGSLSNLELLSLSANQLTGEIPAELGNLANLDRLFASRNKLTGEIPSQLARLTKISQISLYENQLTGEIPAELGSLSNLVKLRLADNQLTGSIPTQLASLANLQELSLTRNQLTGTIPAELARLTGLEILALGGNDLTGPIPTWLGGLTKLEELYLWGNQLTGEIPSQLGSLSNLVQLELSHNQLSGMVPQTLAGLTMLESFSFYNNLGLCAPVDEAFQTWLGDISIVYGSSCAPADSPEDRAVLVQVHSATDGGNWKNSTNWLSDRPIREWHGVTQAANGRVTGLFLSDNQLSGEIPAALGDLAMLESLYASRNQLTGEIPSRVANLANLRRLSLYDNQLTGTIPTGLGGLTNLERLYLDRNQLSGPIPPELGSLANLERLRLHNNQLTGDIPAELGRLTNLTVLRLSGNLLTGCVPTSLRDVADNDFAQLGLPLCPSGDPLITRYDDNRNGTIERSEVIKAINDYLFGEGDQTITRADVIRLINLYLFGPPAAQQSKASGELDGGSQQADAGRSFVENSPQRRRNGHPGVTD